MLQTVRRRLDIWKDKRSGLDFLLVIEPQALGFDESIVHRGSPSGNKYLEELLIDLKIRMEDSILDIGCAKGSAMRTMLNFPFARVDGIELSEELAGIASTNFRLLGKKNVRIFNTNAVDFDGYGNYSFLYLYNPFPEEVMLRVMAELQKQLNPDWETIIIYNTPRCHKIIVDHGFMVVKDYPYLWGNVIRIYSNRSTVSRLFVETRAHLPS